MLQSKLKQVQHSLNIPDVETYLPSLESGTFWSGISGPLRSDWKRKGREALDEGIPSLPATLYMDFRRTGNRARFEKTYFRRRILLLRMTLAYACGERTPELLDGIINLLSAICDEWTWVIPAHNWPNDNRGNAFPPVDFPRVDLFAANTSSLLAMVVHILKNQLAEEAERLIQRVRQECRRRCIRPFLENNAHWWMGYERFEDHGELNNWTPWITENFLHTLFLLQPSTEELSRGTGRAGEILNHYLDVLLPDGGCDEGPSYWDHAIGSLYGCLDILDVLSGGNLNLRDDSFLKKAVSYIHRVHIDEFYFANYADCPGVLKHLPLGLMYRIGSRTGDEALMNLARQLKSRTEFQDRDGSADEAFSTFRVIRDLMHPICDPESAAPAEGDGTDLFPDSQIYIRRSGKLFFSCKGGHNNESHNHNDVGNFILYGGGQPLILDPGVGEYTRETFNHMRYSIWTMQSLWHNLPVVNGNAQREGKDFSCTRFTGDETSCLMSIEKAYPEEAGLLSWTREFSFPAAASLVLRDSWTGGKEQNTLSWNFILPCEPESADGTVLVQYRGQTLRILYPEDQLEVQSDFKDIPPDDTKMRVWGVKRIWRLKLVSRSPLKGKGTISFQFQLQERNFGNLQGSDCLYQ